MSSKITSSYRPIALLVILAVLSYGCGLLDTIDSILRAFGDRCADSTFTVTSTIDSNSGVCTTSDCSLRNAVTLSNLCPGQNSIIVPGGTYILSLAGAGEEHNRTGDLDITDSVNIEGGDHTIIDGNNSDRVFDIKSGAAVLLIGLTIRQGQADARSPDDLNGGGGIRNNGSLRIEQSNISSNSSSSPLDHFFGPGGGILSTGEALEIDSSTITGNFAEQGGGIAIIPGSVSTPSLNLSNSSVSSNTAGNGGGLYIPATGAVSTSARLTRFTIDANTATGQGAGIWNGANLIMDQGEIGNNPVYDHARMGGGIYNTGTLSATRVVIQNNMAQEGDAIYDQGFASFTQSAIVNNREYYELHKGAMEAYEGQLYLENTTVSGNGGGGLNNISGTLHITFSTIANNSSYQIQAGAVSSNAIGDSIVAGSSGEGSCSFYDPGTVTEDGFNIDNTGTCGFHLSTDQVTDPVLQPLVMDGSTFVHPLLSGSPAIDTADTAHCLAVDQRSVSRPQGLGCDRGAYEFAASLPLLYATPSTESPTPESTKSGVIILASPTGTPGAMTLTLIQNANCRRGPETVYSVLTSVLKGQQVQLIGRNDENTWWLATLPGNNKCWISMVAGQPNGDPNQLPVFQAPPTPIPSQVPNAAPNGCSQYGNASSCTSSGCIWNKPTSSCH